MTGRKKGGGRLPEGLVVALCVVLGLPLLILSLPFVLPYLAWEERRRVCPACGRRGTLKVGPSQAAQPQAGTDPAGGWTTWELRRFGRERIDPADARLHCEHCGTEFGRAQLETGARRVPPA